MRDDFKDYVDQHQEDFEFPFDVDKGWKDFESRRPVKKKQRPVWFIAASISLFLLAGIGWVLYPNDPPQQLIDWQEAEFFYQQQIDNMTIMVKKVTDDEQILYDLEDMDRAFEEVKADLKDNADNAEVIEAMMDHYRLKLDILERMLDEIQEENGEDQDISRM
jgi:hypothetical protein